MPGFPMVGTLTRVSGFGRERAGPIRGGSHVRVQVELEENFSEGDVRDLGRSGFRSLVLRGLACKGGHVRHISHVFNRPRDTCRIEKRQLGAARWRNSPPGGAS